MSDRIEKAIDQYVRASRGKRFWLCLIGRGPNKWSWGLPKEGEE